MVPAYTTNGDVLRMRGRGVPDPRGVPGGGRGRGDQYVHIRVIKPKGLTDRQRQLLQEFDQEETGTAVQAAKPAAAPAAEGEQEEKKKKKRSWFG